MWQAGMVTNYSGTWDYTVEMGGGLPCWLALASWAFYVFLVVMVAMILMQAPCTLPPMHTAPHTHCPLLSVQPTGTTDALDQPGLEALRARHRGPLRDRDQRPRL